MTLTKKTNSQSPRKRQRTETQAQHSTRFSSALSIRQALQTTNSEALVETLTVLRNQLTVHHNESGIPPGDARLALAREWMQAGPAAGDLFGVWERCMKQPPVVALLVSVMICLITLLSSHFEHHDSCQAIIRTLLSEQWSQHVNSNLAGTHNELILVTLKLLHAISHFAGGRERKAIIDALSWDAKAFPKLLFMRRKGKKDESVDPLVRPDIRTLYILLVLSLIDTSTPAVLKLNFLEQHRDILPSLFKGLAQDAYTVVRKVLEVCWAGFWCDAKLKRTVKIQAFGEQVLTQLLKLYNRDIAEDDDPEHIPADLVHHFLLAICTRPGVGVCFRDRGWYPRHLDEGMSPSAEDEASEPKAAKIYNKILANLLRSLKVNEDLRQQELAIKILSASPELVATFWSGASLTLEPRLSSKWLANIAVFGQVITLPVPTASFKLPNSETYHPSPPPLSTVLENVLPSVNTKAHLTKGLQSASPLVRHCTALALAKCLVKLGQVVCVFQEIASALEENEQEGQWNLRWREIQGEARRRVPDFQVIIAFAQQAAASTPEVSRPTSVTVSAPNQTQVALLSEAAHRLLWLYHAHLASLVAEARYDSGKALQHITQPSAVANSGGVELNGVHTLQRLHVLALLKETDQLSLSNKAGSSSNTSVHILLSEYVTSDATTIKSGVAAIIQKYLSTSLLFQHDPDEVRVWLSVLPLTKRAPDAHASDGTPLPDEGEVMIGLLDECIQRCLKTPYRYLEELDSLRETAGEQGRNIDNDAQGAHSPLLATLLEQLTAKMNGQHLAPGEALAVATYVRKLVLTLATKHANLSVLRAFAERAALVLRRAPTLFLNHPVVTEAIVREADSMVNTFDLLKKGPKETPMDEGSRADVDQFLDSAASTPKATTKDLQKAAASELVDWLRLYVRSLSADQLAKLFELVKSYHPSAAQELIWHVNPEWRVFWEEAARSIRTGERNLPFSLVLMQTTESEFVDEGCNAQLLELALAHLQNDVSSLRPVLRTISHRLACEGLSTAFRAKLLQFLADITSKARSFFSRRDTIALQETLFMEPGPIKDLCYVRNSEKATRDVLRQLVEECLDSTCQDDRERILPITTFWVSLMRLTSEESETVNSLFDVIIWIKFAAVEAQIELIDWICRLAASSTIVNLSALREGVHLIESLSGQPSITSSLSERLHQLSTLRNAKHLDEAAIQSLDLVITSVTSAALPTGLTGMVSESMSNSASLSVACSMADERWRSCQITHRHNIDITLNQELSQAQAQSVVNLVYRSSTFRSRIVTWLSSADLASMDSTKLSAILLAVSDTTIDGEELDLGETGENVWRLIVRGALDAKNSDLDRYYYGACASSMFATMHNRRTSMIGIMVEELRKVPIDRFTYDTIKIGQFISTVAPANSQALKIAICDHALRWVVRYYAERLLETVDTVKSLHALVTLIETMSSLKAHLVEPAITAIIEHKLSDPVACKLASSFLPRTSLKPAAVNKYLQSILQHASFFRACSPGSPSRAGLVDLLHALFQLHPSNTYQPSHIEPLVKIYGGTCSRVDRTILAIFQHFESQRSLSVATLLQQWSTMTSQPASNAREALSYLDATQMFRTCLAFPMDRGTDDDLQIRLGGEGDMIYDPLFVVLLFARMIDQNPPTHAMGWVELLRTNVVSVILRCLSSKSSELRDLALTQLAGLWKAMENNEVQEWPYIQYVLGLVKNLIPPRTDDNDDVPHIASYTTLLLAHAFRALFYPSTFIYPLTARFLLQRPEFDTSDVPMLFGMLYSSGDDWKKERGWIVRFLAEGMTPSLDEWRVFKRRHTWDLLASLFQSEEKDRGMRAGVLDVLLALTCNRHATTSLVLKSAILPWIEVQLGFVRTEESTAWAKILENIVVIVDSAKIEVSTAGQWRNTLVRCVERLIAHSDLNLMNLLCRVILRLSLLPYPPATAIDRTIVSATAKLQKMEAPIDVATASTSALTLFLSSEKQQKSEAPHAPHEVSRVTEDPLLLWGACVEALWRSAMQLEAKCAAWDALSARILLWRSIVGAEGSQAGEWARKQASAALSTATP